MGICSNAWRSRLIDWLVANRDVWAEYHFGPDRSSWKNNRIIEKRLNQLAISDGFVNVKARACGISWCVWIMKALQTNHCVGVDIPIPPPEMEAPPLTPEQKNEEAVLDNVVLRVQCRIAGLNVERFLGLSSKPRLALSPSLS